MVQKDIVFGYKMFHGVVVIKLGSRVVLNDKGQINEEFLEHVAQQIAAVMTSERSKFVIVTSGAISHGKELSTGLSDSVNAALGQASLISTYSKIFERVKLKVAQILVTGDDLTEESTIGETILKLATNGFIPIINENDVTTLMNDSHKGKIQDNDAVASNIAQKICANNLIILTDTDGVKYTPDSENTIELFLNECLDVVTFGEAHSGRGGMKSKVTACLDAINSGKVGQAVIGNRSRLIETPLEELINAKSPIKKWTMFAEKNQTLRLPSELSFEERKELVLAILDNLASNELWLENDRDIAEFADTTQTRSHITKEKLGSVINGIKDYMIDLKDPLGQILTEKEIYGGINLKKITVPLGRIFVIFESRPDVIPQVISLAILSGNNIVLKGGKETVRTNTVLYTAVHDILDKFGINRYAVTCIHTRAEANRMLTEYNNIQMVIPRGSADLVKWTKETSTVPVLAHGDGVCHVYVDKNTTFECAKAIILDSKLQCPSVCNAAEVILFDSEHKSTLGFELFICDLEEHGCEILAGPRFSKDYPRFAQSQGYHVEYSNNRMTVEWVDGVTGAIDHINKYSSGHTDCIVTNNKESAELFLQQVDSSCVFHNVSTRFADGKRFGLGAEIGISTSKVHARGPVGIEGLLSTKYQARSNSPKQVGTYEQ